MGPIASIILCAGKGRRMAARRTPKVCFPVAGKAAVLHLLEHLDALGVAPNVLVVGHLAGKVIDEVGPKSPHALFAYQAELRGTGHATKQGTVLLQCVVMPDGTVANITVVRSLDSAFGLDQEAIKAARQWQFAPGTRLGQPVAVQVTIEIAFTLR